MTCQKYDQFINNRYDAEKSRDSICDSVKEDAIACENQFAEISANWKPILQDNKATEDLFNEVAGQNGISDNSINLPIKLSINLYRNLF
jgi:hypothetical protein